MAAGAHLPGTAAGGGRALLRRGRRAGVRYAGGGKTAGAAGEPTSNTHYPTALPGLLEPLDIHSRGPCGSGGGEGRQDGRLLPKAQPGGLPGLRPAPGGWLSVLYCLLHKNDLWYSVYNAV